MYQEKSRLHHRLEGIGQDLSVVLLRHCSHLFRVGLRKPRRIGRTARWRGPVRHRVPCHDRPVKDVGDERSGEPQERPGLDGTPDQVFRPVPEPLREAAGLIPLYDYRPVMSVDVHTPPPHEADECYARGLRDVDAGLQRSRH